MMFVGKSFVTNEDGDRVPITDAQARLLALLVLCIAKHGYPPTMRELGALLGIRSTNAISEHFVALSSRRLIYTERNVSRGVRLKLADTTRCLNELLTQGALRRLPETLLDAVRAFAGARSGLRRTSGKSSLHDNGLELHTDRGVRLRWVSGWPAEMLLQQGLDEIIEHAATERLKTG